MLEGFQKEGLEASQILILAPHRAQTLGIEDGETLGPWALNATPDWWEGDKTGQVRFGTVQGFKGLEADVVVYLAPAYRHQDGPRLRYTALSRARHRVVILEQALAEPVRPKEAAPALPKAMPLRESRTAGPAPQAALVQSLRTLTGGS